MALIRYLKGLSVDGNIKFEGSALISSNTADGADNAQIVINGGGADGDTRGASVHMAGNENGNAGLLQLRAGSGSLSEIRSYTAGTERMRINSSGYVRLNNTDAGNYLFKIKFNGVNQEALAIQSSFSGGGNILRVLNSSGTGIGGITSNNTATAFNTSSDYGLQEDLQDFNGLEMVSKISVYEHKWKVDESRSYGVMAHELQEVLPQAVTGEKDAEEYQAVDYSKIVPVLVKAIQELKAEIELLKAK